MRTSELFVAEASDFFKNYDVSAQTRGVEAVRIFFGLRRRGQLFMILCGRRTSFMNAPDHVAALIL